MHAAMVAAIAFDWQFGFYAHNGMLWALFLAAPIVPMWDALWAAPKYQWNINQEGKMKLMKLRLLAPMLAMVAACAIAAAA